MCKDPIPIEHFWLIQMLGDFGAKRNFIILYFLPLPCPKIVSAPLRELIFIDAANKFSIFKNNWNTQAKFFTLCSEKFYTTFTMYIIYQTIFTNIIFQK